MNPGQQMFHDFFMARVAEGNEAEAQALLGECFKKQDDGTFDMAFMQAITPKLTAVLRPECVSEYLKAAAHFKSDL